MAFPKIVEKFHELILFRPSIVKFIDHFVKGIFRDSNSIQIYQLISPYFQTFKNTSQLYFMLICIFNCLSQQLYDRWTILNMTYDPWFVCEQEKRPSLFNVFVGQHAIIFYTKVLRLAVPKFFLQEIMQTLPIGNGLDCYLSLCYLHTYTWCIYEGRWYSIDCFVCPSTLGSGLDSFCKPDGSKSK